MRAVIFILILAVVAVIIALATGLVDINQTRGAKAPDISATGNGVQAQGGQAPAFDVETGSIAVGSKDATVKVPEVKVQRADGQPGNQAAPAQNQAAPATNTAF